MKKRYDFSLGKRGPVIPNRGKILISIDLDDAAFEYFKAESERTGKGYETLINEALVESINTVECRATAADIRDLAEEDLAQDVESRSDFAIRHPKT